MLAKSGKEKQDAPQNSSFKEMFDKEMSNLLKCVAEVQPNINPMTWFKENTKDYPILSRFWLAYSSFPATSCNAERVFNLDGLIVTNLRYRNTLK